MEHALFFDGSSLDRGRLGGPGPSAGAAVLFYGPDMLASRSRYLPKSDSIEAEYAGLIMGLNLAIENGARHLRAYGDSRIVIDHVLGIKLLRGREALRAQALELMGQLESCVLTWIPRRKNTVADSLAKSARV